jgi:tRNA threonylcarbamoyl adenosine modification protein YeaZ
VLLTLDTSSAFITVAVYDDGTGGLRASVDGVGPMLHGERLAPTITDCLAAADVDRSELTEIVVGVGPGPYTGLRVGVVTARTLGLALDIPVRGICSLDAIAADSGLPGRYVVATDARRRELFWAEYDGTDRVSGPFVSRPAGAPGDLPVVGLPGEPVYPSAATLGLLAAAGSVELVDAEPIYLRRPDAVTPGPPKKVS